MSAVTGVDKLAWVGHIKEQTLEERSMETRFRHPRFRFSSNGEFQELSCGWASRVRS